MAKIKTDEEIALLRESGKRLARVLQEVKNAIMPGVTTKELDTIAEELVRANGDIPSFLNYLPRGAHRPYPASLCVSINDEIVHGIPNENRIIKDGDIVSIDLGYNYRGLMTDSAMTVAVGSVPENVATLIKETERSLYEGIKAMRTGGQIGDIGAAIEAVAKRNGYGIVRELGGHGVGHAVHEEPYVPNYGTKKTGPILKQGMVFALEPMFVLGKEAIKTLPDGYTVATKDGSLAAHFEHTIAVSRNGAEILTAFR